MAHKTLINGTAYEITGGRTLVNGTGYDITGGKTLVNGTAYDVGFAKTVTITGSGHKSYAYVLINGVTYTSPTTLSIPIGTKIECRAVSALYMGSYSYGGEIWLNGITWIRATRGREAVYYDHTVTGNTTVELKTGTVEGETYGIVKITEE